MGQAVEPDGMPPRWPLDQDPVIEHLDIYPEDLEALRSHGDDVRALVTVLG